MTSFETLRAEEETIAGQTGRLFVRSWRPAAPAKAVVAICHGFNSHSGYYDWTGEQLAAAGFATLAVDLRGRGRSEGERFYVNSFDDYVADLSSLIALAQQREPQAPLFLLGHSAGGVISCLYARERAETLAGLICEDFAFELPAPGLALAALKGLSHLAPHAHALKLANKDFTRDPVILARMNNDPLIAHESQPLATAAAIIHADERLRRELPAIETPLLILHGSDDKAAKVNGSRHFFEQAGSRDKTLKIYEGRLHDPLNDLGREEVLGDIVAWIGERIALQHPA